MVTSSPWGTLKGMNRIKPIPEGIPLGSDSHQENSASLRIGKAGDVLAQLDLIRSFF